MLLHTSFSLHKLLKPYLCRRGGFSGFRSHILLTFTGSASHESGSGFFGLFVLTLLNNLCSVPVYCSTAHSVNEALNPVAKAFATAFCRWEIWRFCTHGMIKKQFLYVRDLSELFQYPWRNRLHRFLVATLALLLVRTLEIDGESSIVNTRCPALFLGVGLAHYIWKQRKDNNPNYAFVHSAWAKSRSYCDACLMHT